MPITADNSRLIPESKLINSKNKIKSYGYLQKWKFIFSLAFSVTLFLSGAFISIAILLLRRSKRVGGELGGPVGLKYVTSAVLFGLWVIYLVASSLEAYGVIKGF